MLAALKAGDVVIVAKMDRLFRSASDALNIAEQFKADGIKIIIADMSSAPITENGTAKLFFTIMAAVAEFEKGRILERMTEGKRGKRSRGGHTGGSAPYGFRVQGKGRDAKLIEDSEEQFVLERARQLHKERRSLREIAVMLRELGMKSRSGLEFKASQIQRMVKITA